MEWLLLSLVRVYLSKVHCLRTDIMGNELNCLLSTPLPWGERSERRILFRVESQCPSFIGFLSVIVIQINVFGPWFI
jgi:hypothetical protein